MLVTRAKYISRPPYRVYAFEFSRFLPPVCNRLVARPSISGTRFIVALGLRGSNRCAWELSNDGAHAARRTRAQPHAPHVLLSREAQARRHAPVRRARGWLSRRRVARVLRPAAPLLVAAAVLRLLLRPRRRLELRGGERPLRCHSAPCTTLHARKQTPVATDRNAQPIQPRPAAATALHARHLGCAVIPPCHTCASKQLANNPGTQAPLCPATQPLPARGHSPGALAPRARRRWPTRRRAESSLSTRPRPRRPSTCPAPWRSRRTRPARRMAPCPSPRSSGARGGGTGARAREL